jgi:hypothetical protein
MTTTRSESPRLPWQPWDQAAAFARGLEHGLGSRFTGLVVRQCRDDMTLSLPMPKRVEITSGLLLALTAEPYEYGVQIGERLWESA